MKYRYLGHSGLKVSEIAVGAMNFGKNSDPANSWIGPGLSIEESKEIIKVAYENGVNFIDTADLYQSGTSEEHVGEAVKGFRDEVVIATKVNAPTNEMVSPIQMKYILFNHINCDTLRY